ncbi:hypothetical protein [Austwickia chelonae]|uniref:hypothetical protein n=1 Tax=Austwickia chelonae TaxID=100225 RepID=UPI001FE24021|nr:hypothetical protein [Austwickia chelonae]
MPVISTEVMRAAIAVRADSFNDKKTTTVGIDYGEWTTPDGIRVSLIGTPGQVRFSSTRASVVARRGSIVLWLYGDHTDGVQEAAEWIERIGDASVWGRLVIAVTRRAGAPQAPTLDDYRDRVRDYSPNIAVLDADPRVAADVAEIILTALKLPTASAGLPPAAS